ncbi:MAG: hypothetical protein HRT68_04630 [Flavobacteriaceae bacterium]|nr:hypothetical protein [Flavobacteriaceae bacterium]
MSNLVNCFTCHNAVSFSQEKPESPLYVSHIFDAYIETNKDATKDEINTMKDKQAHVIKLKEKHAQ